MKLERVNISGFKSFGDKVELTFHEGVTGVVGPNGCGKSNIADAIGWVLGEQSAKNLRGQKMEDVIFNGSETRPPHSLAEVNLRVSNVNVPAPGGDGESRNNGTTAKARKGEVLVTRRLNRSGDSEYLLDGVPSRLRDVQELFMGTGVGSKAYAIIEQGKIGLILSSKPTDRRVLIEEAAGITKYKSRRRSAELKLTAAQQNLMRVNDIVYEITRQMNSLKRQAGKARRYRRLREELERLDRIVSVKKASRLETSTRLLREKLASVVDEELRRSTSLTVAEAYLERHRLRIADQEVALTDGRDSLHQLELAIDRLDQSVERDGQKLEEIAARRERLAAEHLELSERRGPVLAQLDERRKERAALSAELEGSQQGAERQQGLLNAANLSLQEVEARIEEGRSSIVNCISKIAALHNFLQGVQANADKVSSELLKLDEELREVGVEKTRHGNELNVVEDSLRAQNERLRQLARERDELERNRAANAASLETISQRIASEKEDLSSSKARLQSLEELVAARAHFEAGPRLLLTRGSERGIDVKGSLADAIEVEERFEKAAEAFFASTLSRVLVGSESDIASARRLLEDDELPSGRAELQVEGWPFSASMDLEPLVARHRDHGESGIVGRLLAHVRWASDEVRRSLPDAIVVQTYEDAERLYRRAPAPYVTLDGEVVDSPGVVRLGPGGAGEGLLENRRNMRELSERIESLTSTHETSLLERDELVARVEKLTGELDSLRDRQHLLEKEIVGLEHKKSQLEEAVTRCDRKRSVLESEQERAVSEKSAFGLKRTEISASLEAEEERKSSAENELQSFRDELSTRRGRVEELRHEAAEASSRLAAMRERRDALELDVERLAEGVAELESRLAGNEKDSETLSARQVELEAAVERAKQDLTENVRLRAETADRVRALEEKVRVSRESADETQAALKTRRQEREDVRGRRSTEEIALAREESELAHVRDGFEQSYGVSLVSASRLLSAIDLSREDQELDRSYKETKEKLDAIGPVNPMADEEFEELTNRHTFVTKQRQDLLDSISSTEKAIGRIDRTSRQRFREAFDAINEEFEVTFGQLFGGGRAGLRLVDETDVLESGIDVIAQPPGKKLQNVLLLSGGEKALTAIALLFAIFRYRPSPFCLLDEVDAPLDDANVGRFLAMLRELRDTTQFIIITHNRKTMEMADQLYGVTMEEAGVSKLVSVNIVGDLKANAESNATSSVAAGARA